MYEITNLTINDLLILLNASLKKATHEYNKKKYKEYKKTIINILMVIDDIYEKSILKRSKK